MSISAGSGSTDLKALCTAVFELNDLLRFMKLGKQILYKTKKQKAQSCKDLRALVLIQQSTEVCT